MIDYNDNEGHINPHRGVFSLIDTSFVTIVHLYSVIFKGVTLIEGAQHSYLSLNQDKVAS